MKYSLVVLSLGWCLPTTSLPHRAEGLHCARELQYNSYRHSPVPISATISPQTSGRSRFYTKQLDPAGLHVDN